MATPFFSVVIPMYNVEKYIEATLRSVLSQTFNDYEIIVINDGSSDSSAKKVSSFKDDRILLINQQNSGVSSARNAGIRHSNGEYIAWLDGDDIWHSQYLEMAYAALTQHPDIAWYASRYCEAENVEAEILKKQLFPVLSIRSYYSMRPGFVCSSSNIMKKSALPTTELFPRGVKYGEDGYAWAYYSASRQKLIYNETVSSFYIKRKNSAINTLSQQVEIEKLQQEKELFIRLFYLPRIRITTKLYYIYYIFNKHTLLKFHTSQNIAWKYLNRASCLFFEKIVFRMK